MTSAVCLAGAQGARPQISDDDVLKRVMLSNAMLFLLRGVPVVYYGDEQGFIGHGIDQAARQDMFASQVAATTTRLAGHASTTARDNYDALHPLYKQLTQLPRCASNTSSCAGPAGGARAAARAGLVRGSRIGNGGREILVAFNTSTARSRRRWKIESDTRDVHALQGECPNPMRPAR
jgi:glycosidase